MAKHDKFFSRSLEHLELARQFIAIHLPIHLRDLIDEKNIARVDRTNTDRDLAKHHRDIIYQVPLKNKADGSLLVATEHQSSSDETMPIRYLRYITDNLEAWTHGGEKKKKWPTLVNLLLYHGKESPYPDPCQSDELYQNPLLGNKELYLRFHVSDLNQVGDEELLTHRLCAPMEVLLKHSRAGLLELSTAAYKDVFEICVDTLGDDYLFSILRYVDSIENIEVGKKLHKFVEEVFENKKNTIMTYGQLLGQKSREEGKEEGILIGMEKVARNMLLKLHLDMDTVQKATELPKDELEKILQNNR